MHELNRTISKIDVLLPPVEYIKNILQAICDHLGYSFATVIEVDEVGVGKMLVSFNLPQDYPKRVNMVDAPLLSSPSGEAIETGSIVVVNASLAEPRLLPWIEIMQEYSIRTEVWVPLFRTGKAFGTCVLHDTKKRDVPEEELAVLEQIGVMVSIAITSNQYLSELSAEIEERKIVKEELRQMRDRLEVQVESRISDLFKANAELQLFKDLMDYSKDAIHIVEPESGRFLDVNETACSDLGYTREELLNKNVTDIDATLDDADLMQLIAKIKLDGYATLESSNLRKDGSIFPVEVNIRHASFGHTEYIVAIVRDITERKKAETALSESEKRYRGLFNSASDGIFIHDLDGQFIDANDVACEFLGYTHDELMQMTVMDLHSSQDAPKIKPRLLDVLHHDYIINEASIERDGKVTSLEIKSQLIESDKGSAILSIARDITERKKAETALSESEKRYRGLFNSASDGIFIHDLDGQFIDANDVACEFLGYTHDELIQMTVMDLHSSQDAPKIKPRLLDVLHHDYIINEASIERDGRVTSLEIKSQLIESDKGSAILSIARDITERRQAENALKKSEELFHTLYSTMNEGVALHEIIYSESGEPVDYRILDANPAFESILGIKLEDAKGARVTELYGTSEAPYLDIYAKVAASGNSITFESTFEPMGKTFKIAVFSPGIGKFATLFADITERKQMENVLKNSHAMLENMVAERTEELEKTNRELSDANAKLREVDVMKSEFLDTVSHELRTPLTSIIGYSGLLLDGIQGDMNEKQTQYVGGIWRKGMHQLQLVNDILDLSKLESRSMSVNLEPASVSKTIEDVMRDIMPLVNDKQHEIFVEIAEGVVDVCVDRIRLKQVLLNLISNAIKFTPDNGKIIVKANNEKEMVRISVIDNGMGIKQDDMGKLFNRFIQIDQSNTRHVGGTGLGLAIVKDLMELMGGSVELESEFGKGSTFSILLPEAQSQDASNE